MKQKLLCLLAALAFLLPARLSAFNYKYEGVTLRYEVIDEEAKTCKVSGYKDFSGALVIPDVANDGTTDYCVTEIGEKVFENFSDMTSVVISNSVTSIGRYAFKYCSGLTSVVIGNSVQTIGWGAFEYCRGLTSVVIGNSVLKIGTAAFGNCSGLTSVVIPNSVKEIGEGAFAFCSSLTSAVMGNSVQTIGINAFAHCSGLTSVVIPESVTSIGLYAFNDCSGLIKSAYPNTLYNPFSDGIAISYNPEGAIIEDGWIWGPEKREICFVPYDFEGEYTIPESVETIGEDAFSGCSGLNSVEIPNSVQTIGSSAFSGCSGLNSVEIPNSVQTIGSSAFSGCSGLTSLNIPNSVTSIGESAFSGCSGLTSVEISNSVELISDFAFSRCGGLTSLNIPNSVTSIGESAFSGCSGLTSVEISNSVELISDFAFSRCSGLTSLNIPNSVTSIGMSAFSGCSGLTSVEIPNSVKKIGSSAFSQCSSLTSVVIGESVLSIGEDAFEYCNKITSIIFNAINCTSSKRIFTNCESVNTLIIGDKVKNIPAYFVGECKNLKSLVIPESVTSIGKAAFEGCGLTSLTFNAVNCNAFVDKWYNYAGLVTTQVFPNTIKYLNIGNKVKKIPENFLKEPAIGCMNLTSVVIPNSVTEIGESAFSSCNLETIIMGHGIETIGSYAFSGCPASRIYITAQTPPEIQSNTFSNYKGTLYLQGQAAVNAYDDDKYWGNFNNELMTVPTALEIEGLTSISGNAGDTFQLKAKMTPEDVTLPYILWRSTNPKIATVDYNGVVTLQEYSADDLTRAEGDEDNDGTCRIIAESLYFDGPIAEIVVNNTGVAAASIALDESNLDLKVGQSAKLTATVKNVEDNTVTWTSSDDAVATVDAEGNVTAVAVGEADITATCGSVSASCKVTVTPILAESITISQESWSAHPGETVKLTATVLPEDTTDKTVTWTSSNDDVATVDAEGNVTAVAVGEAEITATCGSVSASCKVTVLPILVESLTIDPTAWSGVEGSEFTIKATVLPENADDKTLTFESSDSSVATVDAEGNVKVLKEGTCVITVSTVDGSDLKAECVVTGLSGVDAIFADPNALVDVYDLNGVMLKKGCSREELKQLKPAVYILRSVDTVVKVLQK